MHKTEFQRRWHEHLDARRDPLDDQELCEQLAADPELLQTMATQRAQLFALPRVIARTEPRAMPRRPRQLLHRGALVALTAGLAVVVATVAAAWLWPAAAPTLPPTRGILAASLRETLAPAGAAQSYTIHHFGAPTPNGRLSTYETRSERR